jgi:hypothetical protein
MDMRFGTWNFRALYRSGSLTAAARELVGYKLYLVGVQEVRWDTVGRVRAGVYNYVYGKRNEYNPLGTGTFIHHSTFSTVQTVELIRVRMLYIVLKGRWFNIIILNVHAPNEEKSDCSKDSFCGELEQVFYHFPTYENLVQNWGERIFSNRQLGMRLYIRKVMIMVLDSKICHIKKSGC